MQSEYHQIPNLISVKPLIHEDERGFFRRNFCQNQFNKIGVNFNVKQGNISENPKKFTLRGIHYQSDGFEEAKIITCLCGSLYNVVIDLRLNSPTYLKWESVIISSKDRLSLIVPAGCANGFMTTSDSTIVHYYMNEFFNSSVYKGIRYNDPYFKIIWPNKPHQISDRDANFPNYEI